MPSPAEKFKKLSREEQDRLIKGSITRGRSIDELCEKLEISTERITKAFGPSEPVDSRVIGELGSKINEERWKATKELASKMYQLEKEIADRDEAIKKLEEEDTSNVLISDASDPVKDNFPAGEIVGFAVDTIAQYANNITCPYCAGVIPKRDVDLCKNCGKKIAWANGKCCKPEELEKILKELNDQKRKKEEQKIVLESEQKKAILELAETKKQLWQYQKKYLQVVIGTIITVGLMFVLFIFLRAYVF
tara:strand:+ start:491 stop:1237 length:747 start_codon:yes stop_codon:yes gene_type:complete